MWRGAERGISLPPLGVVDEDHGAIVDMIGVWQLKSRSPYLRRISLSPVCHYLSLLYLFLLC